MEDMTHIRIFTKVAHLGSFTAAANALDLAPSSVSRTISRLEESLQVKLFHRTTRKLSLTEDGRILKSGAESILNDWQQLESSLSGSQHQPRGLLKLSVPSAVGRNLFVPSLVKFRTQFPEVQLDVSFEDRMADIAGQGYDVVVRTGELADSATHIARKFFDFRLYLCASPAYLTAAPPLRELVDLSQHSILRFRNKATGRLFAWPAESKGINLSQEFIFDDGPAIAKATAQGAGLSVLPTWLCAEGIREGRLVPLLVDALGKTTTPVWLVYLNRQYVASRIQAFVDFMVGQKKEIETLLNCY